MKSRFSRGGGNYRCFSEGSSMTRLLAAVLSAPRILVALAALALGAVRAHAGSAVLYVQDGLIACWDGVENAGAGQHNPSATVWKDVKGGYEFALTGVTIDADRMTFAGNESSFGKLSAADTASTFVAAKNGTMEIVYASRNAAVSQVLLQSSTDSGVAFGSYSSGSKICTNTGSSVKPTFDFSSGSATNSVSVRYTSGVSDSVLANGTRLSSTAQAIWLYPNAETFIGNETIKGTGFPGSIYCIRLYNRQLTDEEIAANHAVDVQRFVEGNTFGDDFLYVVSSPTGIGSPSPFGNTTGLTAGQSVAVSCGATPWTNAAETAYYACTGWKLYDTDGNVVSNGKETSLTYTHPDPAAYRKLEWQWDAHATAYGALAKASMTELTPKSDGAKVSWRITDCGVGSSTVDIYLDYAETDDFANATTVQIGDVIGTDVTTNGSYTLTGLSSGQTRYARLRFVNDGGYTTTSMAISFLTRAAGTFTWTGNGTAGKWDDKDNWDGTDYPRSGDSVQFKDGATADIVFDNDARTRCALSQTTVYAADVRITIPDNGYPFVNSLGTLCLYNSEADKIGRLEVVAPTDADATRYEGYAGCDIGDKNSPDCCNNFLILQNMTSSRAGFGLGKDAPGCTNNWITLKNSNIWISNIQYARGKGNGIIIDDEGFGSSFANARVGVSDGAAVIVKPGSHLARGNQQSFILGYESARSGRLYATNAIMESRSWQFLGVSSTAIVHRCTGGIFSWEAKGGANSYLGISESVQPIGIGDAPAIGGTGEIRISDSFVTNNSILVTAKDVYATNTVMVSPTTGLGANQGWRMKNTSADYESTYVADGGGIVQVGYGGVGYEWGSGSFRNNTLRLRNGAYACFPHARIAGGGQGQGYYNELYPDSDCTNNWVIVETGSQYGGAIGADGKANGYANFGLGYTRNGLLVTDPGSAAWIQDSNPNNASYFTAGTNCTIRVANGATLKAGVLRLRGTRFEFAGDSRGETAFVENKAVTFSDGATLQFEPETAQGWEPVPFAKIVSTAESANTVKILAGSSFRRSGAKHLALATYTENANVAFTLDPESKPSNIELHCDANELWARVPSSGFTLIVR